MANRVIFYCLASPTNLSNLISGDEEVCQLLLPMRADIILLYECARMNEAASRDDDAPTPALLFCLDIKKNV